MKRLIAAVVLLVATLVAVPAAQAHGGKDLLLVWDTLTTCKAKYPPPCKSHFKPTKTSCTGGQIIKCLCK